MTMRKLFRFNATALLMVVWVVMIPIVLATADQP